MEDWQIEYIHQNSRRLFQLTTVNTELLATLLSDGALSYTENELLETTPTNTDKASRLYGILKTKHKGYKMLLDSLRNTNQSGARELLEKALIITGWDDTHQHQKLQNLKIQWHDSATTMGQVFPDTLRDIYAEIKDNSSLVESCNSNLLQDSMPIKTKIDLPLLDPVYLTRYLSRRLEVTPTIFKEMCDDIFIVKGGTFAKFAKLSHPNRVSSSDSELHIHTAQSRHVYLTDQSHFECLIANAVGKPLHLICSEEDKYVLAKTTKITKTLRTYTKRLANVAGGVQTPNRDTSPLLPTPSTAVNFESQRHSYRAKNTQRAEFKQFSTACATEDEFIKELLDPNADKGFCICDNAGMGKSWFLLSCAHKLSALKCMTFFVTLSEFAEYLVPHINQSAIMTLFHYLYGPGSDQLELTGVVFRHILNSPYQKIIIFFDGYDEIQHGSIHNVKMFLRKLLSENTNMKICVSSRPHMRRELENILMVYSYDLLPFSNEDKINTLVSRWRKTSSVYDEDKLRAFAIQCVKICSQVQNTGDSDIFGIPLMIFMLSEIYRDTAIIYSITDANKPVMPSYITSAYELFNLYIRHGYQKVLVSFPGIEMDEEFLNEIDQMHKYTAVKLICPGIAKTLYTGEIVRKEILRLVPVLGVLLPNRKVGGSNFTFIHRTFAEYFMAKMAADYWNNLLVGIERNERTTGFENFFFFTMLNIRGIQSRGFPSISEKKTEGYYYCLERYEFMYKNVVRFANLLLNNNAVVRNPNISCSISIKFDEIYRLLLCCASNNLVTLSSLLVKIVEQRCVNICDNPPSDKHIALLLHTAARWSSSLLTEELFKLPLNSVGDTIQTFCLSYPNELMSPMIPTIERNNLELVQFYCDKLPLNPEELFPACLQFWPVIENERARRNEICSVFIYNKPEIFSPTNINRYLDLGTYDLQIMEYIWRNHDFQWTELSFFTKFSILTSMANLRADHIGLYSVLFANDFDPESIQAPSRKIWFILTQIFCYSLLFILNVVCLPITYPCVTLWFNRYDRQKNPITCAELTTEWCFKILWTSFVLGSFLWIFFVFDSPLVKAVAFLFMFVFMLSLFFILTRGTAYRRVLQANTRIRMRRELSESNEIA